MSTPNESAVRAHINRGAAYFREGDFDQAIAEYTEAIALDPDYADAYNNRGAAYLRVGDFDQAIADYNTTIAITYNNLAILTRQYDMGCRAGTVESMLKPDYADAFFNRGKPSSR